VLGEEAQRLRVPANLGDYQQLELEMDQLALDLQLAVRVGDEVGHDHDVLEPSPLEEDFQQARLRDQAQRQTQHVDVLFVQAGQFA